MLCDLNHASIAKVFPASIKNAQLNIHNVRLSYVLLVSIILLLTLRVARHPKHIHTQGHRKPRFCTQRFASSHTSSLIYLF